MKQSANTIKRLNELSNTNSGCPPLFLNVLKSDLSRLLSQYMQVDEMGFKVKQVQTFEKNIEQYEFLIDLKVSKFVELGKGSTFSEMDSN